MTRQKHHRPVRTPTVLQMEAVECGAAALGMILEHHGCYRPLAELRRECGVSRDGSKASNVLKAARRYGLDAKGFKKSLEAVQGLEPPFIVFWNFNHFVVCEGFKGGRVLLNDPALGHRTVTFEEFDDAFTGVVLLFKPGAEFQSGGRRPRLLPQVLRRLNGSWSAVAYCFLVGLILVIPGLAIPAFTQVFLDDILTEERREWLRPLLVAMVATVGLQSLLQSFQYLFLRRLKVSLTLRMSSQFFWHLLKLPLSFYSQRFAGEIAGRSQLNDKLADVLSGRLATTLIDVVMMGFYALLMFWYDPLLTGIGIFFAICNFMALRALGKRRIEANMRLQQAMGRTMGYSMAALQSMETLKAGGVESSFFSAWAGHYATTTVTRQEMERSTQSLGVLPTFLAALTTVLVLAVGALRVIGGEISIGMLVAFQALMTAFLAPVEKLVTLGTVIQELEGDLARVDDVLAHDAESIGDGTLGENPSEDVSPHLQGHLEIRNLEFGYSPIDPPLIADFNLSVKPGHRVALVGGSGSGKSTVANLVCGLYKPWSGSICFDGVPRDEVPRSQLVNSFSSVSQEVFLFGGSVRENLTMWDSTVPDENLLRACEDAVILEEVLAVPGGLDGDLLEGGVNLSGGQRQRLEIARALVNNPSILVLDEATSALDAETEHRIDERLRLRGCTCLIVAHRLSTIKDCDEIIVMSRGRIAERGTHEELWRQNGEYARLVQTKGGLVQV